MGKCSVEVNEACPLPSSLERSGMDSLETNTHAFVIRIWLEEGKEEGRAIWRGHITHVLSGRRSYFDSLEGITTFILSYLTDAGVDGSAAGDG
jgi:hypothetical protein